MEKTIHNLIQKLQSSKRSLSFDEASTKQALILPILYSLDWDFFNIDEVQPEYPVEGQKVDYALKHGDFVKVFIEVKRIGEDLENHQEQLLNYAFKRGVHLAVLTNGISWWFYLPLKEGSWEQRKFYSIDLYDQSSNEIAQRFVDFLSKESCISGQNVRNAESLYKTNQKQQILDRTLPVALEKLFEEPDENFIELVAEKTEKICGYRPDLEQVERFVASHYRKTVQLSNPVGIKQKSVTKPKIVEIPKPRVAGRHDQYANTKIAFFTLFGQTYPVKTYTDLLMQVCSIVFQMHRSNFEVVLSLQGRKRPYFSKNPNELRQPARIQGSNIYVETNLSATRKVERVSELLAKFGHQDAIQFELTE